MTNENATQPPMMYDAVPADWGRLRRYAAARAHPALRIVLAIGSIAMTLPAVFVAYFMWRTYQRLGPAAFARLSPLVVGKVVLAAITPLLLMLFFSSIMPWLARRANARTPHRRGVRLDRSGVTHVTDDASVTLPWWSIRSIRFDRGATYFMQDKFNAVIVPRRVHRTRAEARAYHDHAVSLWQENRQRNIDMFGQLRRVAFLPEQMDYWEYLRKIRNVYSLRKRSGVLSLLIWTPIVCAYIVVMLTISQNLPPIVLQAVFVCIIVFVIAGSRFDPAAGYLRRLKDTAGAMDPIDVALDPGHVTLVTAAGERRFAWPHVTNIASSRTLIVLEISGDRDPIVIPRRAFCMPSTAEAFLETAQAFQRGDVFAEAGEVWPPAPGSTS